MNKEKTLIKPDSSGIIIHDKMVQGSDEWDRIRRGKITASMAKNILCLNGELRSKTILMKQIMILARKCVLDDPHEFLGNKFTEWGNEYEPEARSLFEQDFDIKIEEVGFIQSAWNKAVGCSPDGQYSLNVEGYKCGLEIKCPSVDVHVATCYNRKIPQEHTQQLHTSLAVTGYDYWKFMSYFPGLKPSYSTVSYDETTERYKKSLMEFAEMYQENLPKIIEAIKL